MHPLLDPGERDEVGEGDVDGLPPAVAALRGGRKARAVNVE